MIAGWLSSRITVGDVWGRPRSAANCRKNLTFFAHHPRARCSASQGLRATPEVSAEKWTANRALVVPIWIVYAE